MRGLLAVFVLLGLCSCTHKGVTGRENWKFTGVLDVNESLQMGVHGDRWYFIPVDAASGNPQAAQAQEAFLMDNGPDYFSEGLARILNKERFGFIDEKGLVVVEPIYDFAAPFERGLSVVCRGCGRRKEGEVVNFEGGYWGIIDRSGKEVVPLRYDSIEFDPSKKKATGERNGKKEALELP